MFRNSSIKTHLMFAFSLAGIALFVTAATGLFGLVQNDRGLRAQVMTTKAVLYQMRADMVHDALRGDVFAALLIGPDGAETAKAKAMANVEEHAEMLEQSLAALEGLDLPDSIRAEILALVPPLRDYVNTARQIVPAAWSSAGAAQMMRPQFETQFADMEQALGNLGDAIAAQNDAATTAAQAMNGWLIRIMAVVSVVLGAIVVWAARVCILNIAKPMARLRGALTELGTGSANLRVSEMMRRDDVGAIADGIDVLTDWIQQGQTQQAEVQARSQIVISALQDGLHNMAAGNLSERIEGDFGADFVPLCADYNQTLETLSDLITNVARVSDRIQSRAQIMAKASENLAARTESQAATLEETAAAIDQMAASVKSAADSAREVEGIVLLARNEADQSGAVVKGAVDVMNEIESSSRQISQIIGVIDDIAFQTNLLALNAGVEAARAGDAGRGFAVVASEVRALAQRSSAAAKEIKGLISLSSQHVGRGVDQVAGAGKALAAIAGRVTEISDHMSQITSGAREQALGLAEINIGVNQLDQVTQKNAALVEDSSADFHALHDDAAQMADLVAQFVTKPDRSPAHRRGAPEPEYPYARSA